MDNANVPISKSKKIIYWIATIWLALGMLSTGIVQLLQLPEEKKLIAHLGYPSYLLIIIGLWKIMGVVAILLPKFPLLKEWAYAGFFFLMSGAVISHIIKHSNTIDFFGPTLLLILTVTSWYCRPPKRKIILVNQ